MRDRMVSRGGSVLSRAIILSFSALLTLILASLLSPSATFANKYYIDCAGGADSNNGTSSSTPWKHAPGMTGFSGTYKHAAGDQIIFKGGVTCPVSYFPMTIASGGTSGNNDYYGVDQTWYSGDAWTRPLFDMNYATVTNSNYGGVPVFINTSYVTIDNIEVAHMIINAGVSGNSGSITASASSTNILVEHCYIHDWRAGSSQSSYGSSDPGSGGISFLNGNSAPSASLVADSNTIGPGQGGDGTTDWCFGTGIWQGSAVTNNAITNACDLVHGSPTVLAGNTFAWGNQPWVSLNHNNVFWGAENPFGTSYIYNNIFIGPFAAQYEGIFPHPCWGGGNSVVYIFDNIIQGTQQIPIQPDDSNCAAGNSSGVYIFNNTAHGGAVVMVDNRGGPYLNFLTLQNNHFISGDSYPYNGWYQGNVTNFTYDSSNVQNQTTAAANAQGYTLANNWAPTSSSGITVGHGTNLTSLCTGGTIDNLCKDRLGNARPTSGAWDAGAYEWGTSSANAPNPPTSLTASVQ